MTISVMMYHAVENRPTVGSDPHYAVTVAGFKAHLALYRRLGLVGRSVRDLLSIDNHAGANAVALTFDDGHQSNWQAAEMLAETEMTADFFVNPSMVGQPGFLDWSQLRDMHAMGMSIQSHGMTHRYLNDMPIDEARAELSQSRAEIESRLGAACTVFAPPGGREPEKFDHLLAETGYEVACTSQPGFWVTDSRTRLVPRFAVLSGTGESTLEKWASGNRLALFRLQCRSGALGALKQAIGNQRYEQWRTRVLGG